MWHARYDARTLVPPRVSTSKGGVPAASTISGRSMALHVSMPCACSQLTVCESAQRLIPQKRSLVVVSEACQA
jgi:hypothetical protein